MKIISTSKDLKDNIERLIDSYPHISFGVAWASASTEAYKLLLKNKAKIKTGVFGTHFYQTHPDVLEDFIESKQVKFALQPTGVFHPKIYLFWRDSQWEAIIGSANFTAGAISKNTELCTLLSNEDGNHLKELKTLISNYSEQANSITRQEAVNYRNIWIAKQPELRKLADQYGEKAATKLAINSRVMSLNWQEFMAEIKKDPNHGFEERLVLLDEMQGIFASATHFKDIDGQGRRAIAGIQNTLIERYGWFGSMGGAGAFKKVIINTPEFISMGLDHIPKAGMVTKSNYLRFINEYLKSFHYGRGGIATATRLLSMKRPDQFLCVDSANRRKLANDFGMTNASTLSYEDYWNEVVERIINSPWWKSAPPESGEELQAWKGRAAMLDAIFYEVD